MSDDFLHSKCQRVIYDLLGKYAWKLLKEEEWVGRLYARALAEQVQTVAHNSLADVVKLTREKLAVVLDTKLFDIKYGSKARQCMERKVAKVGTYAYDMAMFFHPIHADLAFIDTMAKMVASADANYKGES